VIAESDLLQLLPRGWDTIAGKYGRLRMGQAPPQLRHRERANDPPPLRRDIDEAEIRALQEENAELRRLVIQLSKLVIKNVMDQR
jgi:hypothetical protein